MIIWGGSWSFFVNKRKLACKSSKSKVGNLFISSSSPRTVTLKILEQYAQLEAMNQNNDSGIQMIMSCKKLFLFNIKTRLEEITPSLLPYLKELRQLNFQREPKTLIMWKCTVWDCEYWERSEVWRWIVRRLWCGRTGWYALSECGERTAEKHEYTMLLQCASLVMIEEYFPAYLFASRRPRSTSCTCTIINVVIFKLIGSWSKHSRSFDCVKPSPVCHNSMGKNTDHWTKSKWLIGSLLSCPRQICSMYRSLRQRVYWF